MAFTATTLSGAINATQTSFGLTAVTNVVAANGPVGGGSWLFVDKELMTVISVNTTTLVVGVLRGQGGTQAVAHGNTGSVLIGAVADFAGFQPTVSSFSGTAAIYEGCSSPVASATSITATGKVFHITGTTTITNMVPPPGMVEGFVTVLFDGVAAITASGTASGNAFALGCTPTTAGTSITFYLDQATGLWYASRIS